MKNLSTPPRGPADGTLARYKNRIVRVLGSTQSQRFRIQWLTEDGELRVSAVNGKNLHRMQPQLF
ncbi:hypothetical protein KAF44_30460 (plasmid) [Cupriavidus necator]|nr:hypothetical protein KAF44_30460 [Cupriavidus necator]